EAGSSESKEKAQAARHLAAFKRLENAAEAADLYRQAATLDPSNPQNWIDFAELAQSAGRPLSEARHALITALEVAKGSQETRTTIIAKMWLGDVLRDEGKLDLAK